MVPNFNSVKEEGFKNLTLFFFEAGVGVTYSSAFLGILIGCKRHENRRPSFVDAKCDRSFATRGCSGGNGSDKRASRS